MFKKNSKTHSDIIGNIHDWLRIDNPHCLAAVNIANFAKLSLKNIEKMGTSFQSTAKKEWQVIMEKNL